MEQFFQMLNVQGVLFLYILVGIFCRKQGIFSDGTRADLTDFVLFITLPCMIFSSFHVEFSLELLREGVAALVIAAAMALLAWGCGKLLYRPFPPEERSVLQYGTLVTNAAFAGLPIIGGMYDARGLLLASMFIIPTRILMWSAGLSLFTGSGSRGALRRVALHPAMVAVYLGLLWMFSGVTLPNVLVTAVTNLGAVTSPLAMALVGALLADIPFRAVLDAKALYVSAVRQLALPLLCYAVLRALGTEPLTLGVCVLMSGMPVATTTAILAQKYGADAPFASKCVVVSTATSLLTVPLLALLLSI